MDLRMGIRCLNMQMVSHHLLQHALWKGILQDLILLDVCIWKFTFKNLLWGLLKILPHESVHGLYLENFKCNMDFRLLLQKFWFWPLPQMCRGSDWVCFILPEVCTLLGKEMDSWQCSESAFVHTCEWLFMEYFCFVGQLHQVSTHLQ